MDDRRIIEMFFERSERALFEVSEKYKKVCEKLAGNILRDSQETEECVNDVLYCLWDSIPPENPKNLCAYVCAVTRNQAFKRLNYETAAKRNKGLLISLSELEEVLADEKTRPDATDSEIAEAINRFLEKQPPLVRKIFISKYWFYRSLGEISAMYSCSESKVKNILYRTRKQLRDYLKKEGIEI